MKKPPIPKNENHRLYELKSYNIMGENEQEGFDFLTRMAAEICNAKISLISLITEDKQWFLSHHGLEERETAKDYSFCAHAINTPKEPFIVEDARKDERFEDNPLFTGHPEVIFYAGIPLVNENNAALGSICVIDDAPRTISESQLESLRLLADQAIKLLELRRRTKSLKDSEQNFQSILNSSYSFIWFLSPDGTLLKANDTALEMAGITHEDVIGRKFWDCYWWQISEKTQNDLKEKIRKAQLGEEVTYEVEVWIKDKTPITILFSLRPVFDARGMVSYIIPEGRAIQEIVDARNRYRAVIEGTQAGTYEWNIETDEIIINDRYAEMLGYTVDELEPFTMEKWSQNVHSEDLQKARKLIKKCFKKEVEYYQLEMRLKHKSGHWVWGNTRGKIFEWYPSGKALKMYGTLQEITKRKSIEKKLNEERSLLRTIIDSSPDSIYVKDLEGRKLVANKIDCYYCGVEHEEELIGKTDFDFYPEEKARKTHKDDQIVLVNGKKLLNREEIIYGPAGDKIWLLTSKLPLYDQDGNISGLVGIGRNITQRKQAEEAREELLKRFELIGDHIPGVIYQYKLKPDGTSRFPYASTGIEDIYSVTPEQVEHDATPVFNAIHPDDLEQVSASINESAENLSSWQDTYRVNLPSGETTWVEGNATPQKQDDGSILWHGFIQNITERKHKEEALRVSEEAFRGNFENSAIGMALLDENGKWLKVNERVCEIVGYSEEELMKLTFQDITHPEDLDSDLEYLNEVIRGERDHYQMEKKYIHKGGKIVHIILAVSVVRDSKGEILYFISQIIDITAKKETARRLHEALSSLQNILDASTQVGIIATDSDGTITQFNKGAEKMLGYRAEEVVGKNTPQLIHLDDEIAQKGEELSEELGKPVQGFDVFVEEAKQGEAVTNQWTYKRKDGSTYPVLLSVTAIRRDNEITGFLGVATDITPLEKAKKDLRLLLNFSEKQNERLKNFAHIVTHNLRSHSSGIYGVLDLIELEYPDIYANEYVQLLNEAGNNLKETIENLTDIVKQGFVEEEELKEVNLKKAVESNISSAVTTVNKNKIEIINEVEDDIKLSIIPAYLDSIIMNFLTNAIKYSSPERDSYVKIYTQESEEYIQLLFEDNGVGIDLDEHEDELFGMYNTFHDNEDSRGIGLSITKNQIESLGGHVEVESEVNKGTTFKVSLPNSNS